jgi:hypothetical protein
MFDEEKSLENGAVLPWRRQSEDDNDGYYLQVLRAVCQAVWHPVPHP